MTVLFVCAGNTCRSPLAAAIGNALAKERAVDLTCVSRGLVADTGESASTYARMVAAAHFLDLTQHESQPLTERDIAGADEVYTMTARHRELIVDLYHTSPDKVKMLAEVDIDDPWGGDLTVYETVYRQLAQCVAALPVFA